MVPTMKFVLIAAAALAAVACAPVPADFPAPQSKRAAIAETPPAAIPADPVPAAAPSRLAVADISGIRMEGVAFDSRRDRLAVVDQAGGPGSHFTDSAAAAESLGGIAALNAGFFTPQGTPLGLVVSGGKTSGGWNSASSLGSGIWFENAGGDSAIVRREALSRGAAASMRELIQAGPILVENGRAVGGLDRNKSSARSFLLWDGGVRWWLGRADPCPLRALAAALEHRSPAGWPVRRALNLDGGRSSDLWISGNIAGGPLTRRPLWNRPVRNFLVLVPRAGRRR
jgi:hypothetical protein